MRVSRNLQAGAGNRRLDTERGQVDLQSPHETRGRGSMGLLRSYRRGRGRPQCVPPYLPVGPDHGLRIAPVVRLLGVVA